MPSIPTFRPTFSKARTAEQAAVEQATTAAGAAAETASAAASIPRNPFPPRKTKLAPVVETDPWNKPKPEAVFSRSISWRELTDINKSISEFLVQIKSVLSE